MAPKKPKAAKTIPYHPLANEYPMMSEGELALLEADMRENGFDARYPIILYKKQILDGRNRYTAALAAGVEPVTVTFRGSEEAARAFVKRSNENRRHLNSEWLQKRRQERVERVAVARKGGKSTRAIASAEGVSQSQVRADLAKASTEQGCSVEPETGTVTGADGRVQPASKPRRETTAPAASESGGKSANGQPLFDWRGFELAYGALVREIDRLGGLYHARETPAAEGLSRQLAEFYAVFEKWHQQLRARK